MNAATAELLVLPESVWRARQEFFTGDFPCSTLVQVAGLASPAIKVEITCQAMAGSGS